MTTQLYELDYPSPIWDWLMANFETDQERLMALQKLEVAKAVIQKVQTLAPLLDSAPDLYQEYWDAGGNFTDQDVEMLGVTGTELGDIVNFLNEFTKFMNGEAVGQNIWRLNFNKIRRVQA